MGKKVTVDYVLWHRLRLAVEAMQGTVIYMEDDEGVLRRWYPPSMPKQETDDDK